MISCLHHAILATLGALRDYLKDHARKLDEALLLCGGDLLDNDTTSVRYFIELHFCFAMSAA